MVTPAKRPHQRFVLQMHVVMQFSEKRRKMLFHQCKVEHEFIRPSWWTVFSCGLMHIQFFSGYFQQQDAVYLLKINCSLGSGLKSMTQKQM